MTDRELLELAAKAAGIPGKFIENHPEDGAPAYSCGIGRQSIYAKPWNPLANDGDALRLAVKMNISIDINGMFVHADCRSSNAPADTGYTEENSARNGGCMMKATRLAIVRAAALIGEAM